MYSTHASQVSVKYPVLNASKCVLYIMDYEEGLWREQAECNEDYIVRVCHYQREKVHSLQAGETTVYITAISGLGSMSDTVMDEQPQSTLISTYI